MVDGNDPERLVVVTSTPEGVAPLTPGERSMIQNEPDQIEQTAVVGHAYPNLLATDPARAFFDAAREAFARSDGRGALSAARQAIALQPDYLPAHLYEELGLTISRGRNLDECRIKCLEILRLGEELLEGRRPHPPTERPVESTHVRELLDMVHYNLSDRLMRLGAYDAALQHVRLSASLPKNTEGAMKRLLKEASLLFRLDMREQSLSKLRQARNMDRELFYLLRDRMALDGHLGVDEPV